MAICALGYIGVRSNLLTDWSDFATSILGMQKIDRSAKSLAFRMDSYQQRLAVSDEPGDTLAFIGWEVEKKSDLQSYGSRLDKSNIPVHQGSKELIDRRFVNDLIYFEDPGGNRVELFYNPVLTKEPFISGRPIDGFKTDSLGMGHAVLHVKDIDPLLTFYRDLLDFKVSDYGLTPFKLYFFHVNERHHSFAMVGSGKKGIHHFMIEFENIDDVGQGYDLAQRTENGIAYTIGRHTNDHMFSYYAISPSGFLWKMAGAAYKSTRISGSPMKLSVAQAFGVMNDST